MPAPVIVLAVLALVVLVFVASGIKIVRPYQRALVERLGKYKQTVDPGLRIIIPGIDRMTAVDMREQVIDVPPQEVITSDNVVTSVDAVVFYEATDPKRLVYNVGNFILAITKLAQTNLRNVVGDLQLDEALTSRDKINSSLRTILDDATDNWGVRVVRVEIQRVDPPPDVMSAMHEVMKAERTRRAVVTEAQGAREAAITRAEGEKASSILEAEGRKQRNILDAQGEAEATRAVAEAERFRRVTVAEGEALAIRSVFEAIHEGRATPDVLALKYFEALREVAAGQATKIFLPADAGGLLGTLAGALELAKDGAPAASGGPVSR
ncbi:MAG TPA: SPFH domain-containing protein [Acidimicrobiales bacterium]|nr:SPFH domain-containing protein [Acidimicrobiales bacterium]